MSLRDSAIKATVLSELMSNREKISTDELIGRELTISKIDMTSFPDSETGEIVEIPILVFNEFPNNFYMGGAVLNKIVTGWIEEFKTVKAVNDELAISGIGIKLNNGRSKKGRRVTTVEIL